MQGDDRHFSYLIDAGVGPRSRGQIGDGANVQVVTERDLGRFSRSDGLTGKSEDNLIDEFGARQPVQVCDSPQYRRGKRQFVIHEAADVCAVERILAQGLSDGGRGSPTTDNKNIA